MAAIPGVTVTRGLRDAVGRTGIGVTANGQSWLLLDPQTYRVIGVNERTFCTKSKGKAKAAPITFTGTTSMAWVDVAIVDAPGQR
jgi:hypothetical protein